MTSGETPTALYCEPLLQLDPSSPRSIRVLDLLQGPRDAPICARLRVVSLDAHPCPYYEALSYTWRPSTPAVTVTINDRHALDITANAFAALESLRLRRATRTLWIDSICIDQKNDGEKNVQVPLMGDIYRSAAVVNVWLGRTNVCHEPRTRIANLFDTGLWRQAWHEVRRDIKAPTIGGEDTTNARNIKRLARKQAISNIRSDLQLFWHSIRGRHLALADAIKTNSPWHERLWIVQEYLLAKQLRFGFGFHWVTCDIAALLGWAKDDSEAVGLFKSAMGLNFEAVRVNLSWIAGAPYTSLGGLQNILRTQQCYRPEDMVYGMLGLIDPYEAALITVNYDMDFWKVFAQATYAAIRSETTFHVLDMVDLRARRNDYGRPSNLEAWRGLHEDASELLPSWSIDFAHFPKQGVWQQGARRDADLAKRREQLQSRCSLSYTCGRLSIKAIPFDKIVSHAPIETPADETGLGEDDVVYKLLFSIIAPTLVAALTAREMVAAGDDPYGMSLAAAPLLTSSIKVDEVLELVGDSEMFSRRAHVFLSIAMPPAANVTIETVGEEDQVIHYQITGGNIAEPRHDPTVNAIKTACLLWASLSNTPVDMQRSGQVNVDVDEALSFLRPCSHLRDNAMATSGGLSFFGTVASGMVGIAPLGVDIGDLIVRAPDEECFLVLRQRRPEGGGSDGTGVVWQFMGRALIFSMHTPQSWERDELRDMVSLEEAPTFHLC